MKTMAKAVVSAVLVMAAAQAQAKGPSSFDCSGLSMSSILSYLFSYHY